MKCEKGEYNKSRMGWLTNKKLEKNYVMNNQICPALWKCSNFILFKSKNLTAGKQTLTASFDKFFFKVRAYDAKWLIYIDK